MLDIQNMRQTKSKPFNLWSDEEKASRFVAVAKATKWFFRKDDPPTLLDGIDWQVLLRLMQPCYDENVSYDDVQYVLENSQGKDTADGFIVTDIKLNCYPQDFNNFLFAVRSSLVSWATLKCEDDLDSLDMPEEVKDELRSLGINSTKLIQDVIDGNFELCEEMLQRFYMNIDIIRTALLLPRRTSKEECKPDKVIQVSMQDILNAVRKSTEAKSKASGDTEVIINLSQNAEGRACMDVTSHLV